MRRFLLDKLPQLPLVSCVLGVQHDHVCYWGVSYVVAKSKLCLLALFPFFSLNVQPHSLNRIFSIAGPYCQCCSYVVRCNAVHVFVRWKGCSCFRARHLYDPAAWFFICYRSVNPWLPAVLACTFSTNLFFGGTSNNGRCKLNEQRLLCLCVLVDVFFSGSAYMFDVNVVFATPSHEISAEALVQLGQLVFVAGEPLWPD